MPETAYVDEDGQISFMVTPNSQIDEGKDFFYTVGVYDNTSRLMYRADIVMPDAIASIWDLIPVPVDLDAPGDMTIVTPGPEPEPEPEPTEG